jgi:hypothetical protein
MKSIAVFAALTVLSAVPVQAAEQPVATLKVSATSGYEMWCQITPSTGEEVTRSVDPARGVLAMRNPRRATCTYKFNSGIPVSVAFTGSAWACPFVVTASGGCEHTFDKASFGTFDIRRKPN